MIEVVPAIIAKSYGDLEEKIKMVEPYIARVQLDIMDGRFVDNRTIDGYDEIKKLDTGLLFEVHLMVEDPAEYMEKFLEAKRVNKYILHAESRGNLNNLITMAHERKHKVGLALNPQTPNGILSEYIDKLDFVQFMTVDPGFYGSSFVEDVLDKMTDFHYMNPSIPLQVDGGINEATAEKAVQAGAAVLVSGSYIFNSDDVAEAIYALQRIGK